MSLDIQIKTLLYSFLFGIYFSIIVYLNYKIIYKLKKFYLVIGTFLIIFLNILLYFLVLLKVNNGIIHIYGIISLILGYFVCHFIYHFIEKSIKK